MKRKTKQRSGQQIKGHELDDAELEKAAGGNFEIQRLMSSYNQAETLSSNVKKKLDDTVSAVAKKIG